jgi:guanylate kinase
MHKLFCLVGPSGVGKDTIKKHIMLPHVISYRTRPMRKGETDGVDGHFITKDEFLIKDQQNEWIAKTDYDGHYYGITIKEIEKLKHSPMLYVIDWDGVVTLKDTFEKLDGYDPKQIVSIFIYAPKDSLIERMSLQGRDRKTIESRIARLEKDYEAAKYCDYIVENYDGEFHKTIISIYEIIIKETFSSASTAEEFLKKEHYYIKT